MSKQILFITVLLCGQLAFGQSSAYGKYRSTGLIFDSLRLSFYLSLKQDGSYTMEYLSRDSLMTEFGKWRQKANKIELRPKYSKAEKQYALQRTFVLNIEGDKLIWKPDVNKR